MRSFALFLWLFVGAAPLFAQHFGTPLPVGGRVVASYRVMNNQTFRWSDDESYLTCFTPAGVLAWKLKMSDLGVEAATLSYATTGNEIFIMWGGDELSPTDTLHFAVLDSNGRRVYADFTIIPQRDIPGARNRGHWYLGSATRFPHGGLRLEIITTDDSDNPTEEAYIIKYDARQPAVLNTPRTPLRTPPTRNLSENEFFGVDSLSFNAATRRFVFRATVAGTRGTLVQEPAALPQAWHYLAPVCTACMPGLATEEMPPITAPHTPNPAPGQARPGVGMADTVWNPGSEVFDAEGNPDLLPLLANLTNWSTPQVYYTGPGQFVVASHGTAPNSVSLPSFTALALAGVKDGRFIWRTVVYVPFGDAYSNPTALPGTNGSLRLGLATGLRPVGIAIAEPSYLALEIAPDGTLANLPVWYKGDGGTYGNIHPLPGGGVCISQQGHTLEFYGPTGPVLRRVNGVE